MQIQVDIDGELLRAALEASGMPNSTAVIEKGLRMIIVLSHLDIFCDLLPGDSEDPPRH